MFKPGSADAMEMRCATTCIPTTKYSCNIHCSLASSCVNLCAQILLVAKKYEECSMGSVHQRN
jgi:hypothetical protein